MVLWLWRHNQSLEDNWETNFWGRMWVLHRASATVEYKFASSVDLPDVWWVSHLWWVCWWICCYVERSSMVFTRYCTQILIFLQQNFHAIPIAMSSYSRDGIQLTYDTKEGLWCSIRSCGSLMVAVICFCPRSCCSTLIIIVSSTYRGEVSIYTTILQCAQSQPSWLFH